VIEKEEKEKIKQLYNTTQQNEKHRQTFIDLPSGNENAI